MKVTINGSPKEVSGSPQLADLVSQFCKYPKNIITEVNGTIITSKDWNTITIKEGDTVELVAFVGGG